VNREGTFLAHKDPGRILTENIAQLESYKNIFGTKTRGVIYTDYRGIEVIGASRMVGGTDWALVVEQDREEAFRTVDGIRRPIFMVIVFSLCGTLLSAWLLSRYVATPIRRLGQAANFLATGEFEKVNIERSDRRDEVGVLYRAFGEMARQLEDRQRMLEEKVIRREVKLKATEEAAARSQQLASLGQLAAGVAHEIRTPLTSLKMFLEAIESEMEIAEEYEEDFRVALRQIARMEATIHRFLDFARPEDPVLTQVDVTDLIEDAFLMVGPRAKQQETLLQTQIDEDLPPIRADRKQLGEALLNLMVNGLEAMGSRGRLNVTAHRATVSWDNGIQECVQIDVTDTGPGISEEIRPRLFDPFFTTKATGTGLGLSTVHSSLQRHGGKVSVESIVGRGSTFSLFIPIEQGGTPGEDGKDTGS
jgi:signal transduction histidine kinase